MAKEERKISIVEQKTIEEPLKGFVILVESLGNLIGKTFPFSVSVQIQYLNEDLGKSPLIQIENDECNPINFETLYKIEGGFITAKQLDEITAHPIVFTVSYKDGEKAATEKPKSPGKGSKKLSTAKSSKKSIEKSSIKSPSKTSQELKTLGSTNLDILPLLFGEPIVKEVLLLEDSVKKTGSEVIVWTNLPKLNVRVEPITGSLEGVQPWNIICFTLESLYNFPPNFVTSGDFEVVTAMPLSCSSEDIVLQNRSIIRFRDGKISSCPFQDAENMKRWFSLGAVTGRSALSKYRVHSDLLDLKNTLKIKKSEVIQLLNSTEDRLEWNMLRRCWMETAAQEDFFQKIVKYRCWPLEFKLQNKIVDKDKKKIKSKSKDDLTTEKSEIKFIAFLDLSGLLYPGVTRTHITSQLFTYVAKDVIEKWGEELFPPPPLPPQESPAPSKGHKTSNKTKGSVKHSPKSKADKSNKSKEKEKKKKKSVAEEEIVIVEEEVAVELLTEDGRPVFVTVEIELMHPLVRKKTEEEILKSVLNIVPPRVVPEPSVVASQTVQTRYEECIESLITYINEQYQDFYSYEEMEDEDNDTKFLMHLHGTGAYSRMNETVRKVVMDYIRDKIGLPSDDASEEIKQSYISDVYVKLVEEMNKTVNLVMEGHEVKDEGPICSAADLYYFAVESLEQNNATKAEEYLLKRLDHSKGIVPKHWLDYAIYHLTQFDFEKAEECAHEVLSLDIRQKEGLLFYALLEWNIENFEVAELFFNAVVGLFPRYYQAWFCFHLFYTQIENKEGADNAYVNGMTTLEDIQNQTTNKEKESKEDKYCLLSWCPGFEDDNKPFVSTAILLLKLGFPEFAETCLARELQQQGGPTLPFLYYLAVSHYKQLRYEDSLSHLEQALHLEWKDVRLWTLKGHNLYKLKKENEAEEAYQFVLECEDVPKDLHLTYLRMGQFSLNQGDYEKAKKMFLNPCENSPTPLVWLGLGMTSYMLEQYEDAEMSLSETNMLDPSLAEVWLLLALVNMKRCRFKMAKKCENEAIRLGVTDSPFSQELTALKATLAPCCS